ncbi:TetR/AcrR family transcriptional regulator [Nonomuraea purpurea]|uniref:TetR/AcrR family transcriptional regulator n=1 Tax=Nonomuraea purpurea TaxID=1849276 RepID=A0ABV8GNR7_9ACTN
MIVRSSAPTSKGRRTRAVLLQAGREAFEEHGYDAVRIDDVWARAGVSHGTFHTYFRSKEALFGDPYARVEAANRLYLRAWAANSRLVRMLEQAATADDPSQNGPSPPTRPLPQHVGQQEHGAAGGGGARRERTGAAEGRVVAVDEEVGLR